jgi:hypothetical protein
MSAISNIRHRPCHLYLLSRYRKKISQTENCHSDIGRVSISTSESIPISDIKNGFIIPTGLDKKLLYHTNWIRTHALWFYRQAHYRQLRRFYMLIMLKLFSDIRYNVGLRSLQSDIRGSDIRLSPISGLARYRRSRISD